MKSWKTPSNLPVASPMPGSTPATLKPVVATRVRSRSLVGHIVDCLAAQIESGEIRPDERLPSEAAIMRQFEVSRTVVREAISRLQARGLAQTRHGVGTFALAQSVLGGFKIAEAHVATVADVLSVLELRISLETEAAGLAAQRRTEAHLQTLAAALRRFEDAIALQHDDVQSDFDFHLEVARATGNRHFSDLMGYLGMVIIPRTRVNTPSPDPQARHTYLTRVSSEHQSIFEAIRNADAQSARAAMYMHLANGQNRLRQVLGAP